MQTEQYNFKERYNRAIDLAAQINMKTTAVKGTTKDPIRNHLIIGLWFELDIIKGEFETDITSRNSKWDLFAKDMNYAEMKSMIQVVNDLHEIATERIKNIM